MNNFWNELKELNEVLTIDTFDGFDHEQLKQIGFKPYERKGVRMVTKWNQEHHPKTVKRSWGEALFSNGFYVVKQDKEDTFGNPVRADEFDKTYVISKSFENEYNNFTIRNLFENGLLWLGFCRKGTTMIIELPYDFEMQGVEDVNKKIILKGSYLSVDHAGNPYVINEDYFNEHYK